MSREIRITIDDDEVFERMKRRKRDLDLSWEEVLHRGLRTLAPESGPPTRGRSGESGGTAHESGGPDRWDAMAGSLESEIKNQVYNSIRRSFGAAGIDVPKAESLDREMASLEAAEDAVLSFPFLDEDAATRVPLRVNLRTSAEGLDIEVVAVRSGKSVASQNTFTGQDRATITKGLAGGKHATLSMADGAEQYRVEPILEWGRSDDGRPTVTDVEVARVVFDAD